MKEETKKFARWLYEITILSTRELLEVIEMTESLEVKDGSALDALLALAED